jgi:hypothetical protein
MGCTSKADNGDTCAKDEDCGIGLRCDETLRACFSPQKRGERRCKQSEDCKKKYGKCGFKDGGCEPTEQGCRESINACKIVGECGFKDGECVATEQGCKASSLCEDRGNCGVKDGACAKP